MSRLFEQDSYPIRAGCELLELSRSSYYYAPVQVDEHSLEKAIDEIAGEFPVYGTRRVMHQLRRSPYEMRVNRKRVRRIMAKKGLLRAVKRSKKRTTDSAHPYPRYPNLVKDLQISYPEQAWVSDITYIRLEREFVYLAIILDVFTRAIPWLVSEPHFGSRVDPDGSASGAGRSTARDPPQRSGRPVCGLCLCQSAQVLSCPNQYGRRG